MRVQPHVPVLWALALALLVAGASFAGAGERFVEAVRQFAENAIRHGRDVYGPKRTPLFVDGLNVETKAPAVWKRKGEEWVLSNLASQQDLLRTLVGLTALTGDEKYRRAAEEAVRYAFQHLRSPNGLIHWGGHVAYDAAGDRIVMEQYRHELKRHYPFYEFMWALDRRGTRRFLETFWAAHILDWSRLDMNRHGDFRREPGKLWRHEYEPGEVFFESEGLTFCNTGSDLIYAAALLHLWTGEEGPIAWAERLAERYAATRNPKTGLVGYQYSCYARGDRARKQFGPEFGDRALEGTVVDPGRARIRYAMMGIVQLRLSEMLAPRGGKLRDWALADLGAYAEHAYDPEANLFKALLTDGTPLSPEDVKRKGYYGASTFRPRKPGGTFFRAYATAARLSEGETYWRMARLIGKGLGLGDVGVGPEGPRELDMRTGCADPKALLGLLELHRKTGDRAFLDLASAVGGNIVSDRFRNGLFIGGPERLFARLGAEEPLALLHLAAALQARPDTVPYAWPGEPYFHCPFDGLGRTYDSRAIYERKRDQDAP